MLDKKLLQYTGVYVTNSWKNISYEKLKKLFVYNNVISMFFYIMGKIFILVNIVLIKVWNLSMKKLNNTK